MHILPKFVDRLEHLRCCKVGIDWNIARIRGGDKGGEFD